MESWDPLLSIGSLEFRKAGGHHEGQLDIQPPLRSRHPDPNCEGVVRSLHSFAPPFFLVLCAWEGGEVLESWAQVLLATLLSSLCLEQGINLSQEGGEEELRPRSGEGEKSQWALLYRTLLALVLGRGSLVSPLTPWLWTGARSSALLHW